MQLVTDTVRFTSHSWIDRTHQRWKLYVFLGLAVLDFFLFVGLIWRVNHPANPPYGLLNEITLSLLFVACGLTAFGWLSLALRCPVCRRRVFGHVLRHASVGGWFTALLSLARCPHCESDYET